jgi:hypothetical protein
VHCHRNPHRNPSEEAFERLCDAEMAKVDAMMAMLRAAVDEDRWPREYYVGGI